MIIDDIFKYKRVNFDKLVHYGFKLNNEIYEFKTDILDDEFELYVYVSKEGQVSTKVLDKKSQDEYVLHLMKDAGGFASQVKDEFEKTLQDINEKCFDRDVFKSKQSKEIIEYIKNQYGAKLVNRERLYFEFLKSKPELLAKIQSFLQCEKTQANRLLQIANEYDNTFLLFKVENMNGEKNDK